MAEAIPTACPAARVRLPPHLVVYELAKPKWATRYVVAASSLTPPQCAAIAAACTERRQPFVSAKRVGSGFTESKAKDAEVVALADTVAEVCFPIEPSFVGYRAEKTGGQVYLAVEAIDAELGVDTLAEIEISELHVDDVVVGSIEGRHTDVKICSRSPPFPHCHTFVSLSVAVSAFPQERERLFASAFAPGAPSLPLYRIVGAKGEWVSLLDLSVAAQAAGVDGVGAEEVDEDGEALTFASAMQKRAKGRGVCNAVRSGNGLERCLAAKRGSAPFVGVAWLIAKQGGIWDGVSADAAPAVPGAPVLMLTNAAKRRVQAVPRGSRVATYQMTLRRRLRDPDATLPPLMDVVTAVRKGAEYGSLLLNLHVMRLLDEGGGRLPDGPGPDLFDLRSLACGAMVSVRRDVPQHPGLADTFRANRDVLGGYVDGEIAEVGNTTKYEATNYVATAYSSVSNHGAARVAALLSSARRLYGGGVGCVHRCVEFVEGRGSLPDDLPPELAALAVKYQTMYAVKGLHNAPGFDVNCLPKAMQAAKHRRCLELFWEMNRDHRAMRDRAVASGRWRLPEGDRADEGDELVDPENPESYSGDVRVWKSSEFAPLPVTRIRDRFVLVDGDVLKRKVFRGACESETFVPGDISSLFKSDGAARSVQSGWERAPLFRTDGTALQEIWFHRDGGAEPPEAVTRQKGRSSGGKKDGYATEVPVGVRRVGDDPGITNEHFVCERLSDGECRFDKLTKRSRDELLRPLTERRERRVVEHAAEALKALSSTRRRTSDVVEFRRYALVRQVHQGALERAYCCRSARSERFERQRLLTSRLDSFINSVIDGGENGRRARLEGKLYWGEGNATNSAQLARRLRTAHKGWVEHVWVDEFGTSKFDCITHQELAPAFRRGVGRGGQAGWVKDRDVKFRTTECTLESRHPCPFPTALLADKGFRESDLERWLAVDRDGNAAYAILALMGVPEDERPACYRRTRDVSQM